MNPDRWLGENISAELAAATISSIGKMVSPLLSSSFPIDGTIGNEGFLLPIFPPINGTLMHARRLGPYTLGDHITIGTSSFGAEGDRLVDVRSTFEKAQRLYSMAFDKLKF